MTATGKKIERQSGYLTRPDYDVHFEPCPKRVRVNFNGETIADSVAVMRMHESKHIPVYYFPRADVRMDLLQATEHESFCPYKGEASYWTISAGDRSSENAVWSYEAPFEETAEIKDYIAFFAGRVDGCYIDDEKVVPQAGDFYGGWITSNIVGPFKGDPGTEHW